MATTFIWLLRMFLALVALAFLALACAYWFASRSLPDYSATHEVHGLTDSVEMVRSTSNVPHIFGQSDEDVYFGLGFAHAQDRLWQMTMLRRTAQGRLSELFGERTVGFDKLLRRLDLYTLAAGAVEYQDARTTRALDAYAAGVNDWLRLVNREALGRGAPENFFFPSQIEEWRPADSLAIVKLMGLQLSPHLHQEILRARTSLLVPNERLADILHDSPGAGTAALPEYAEIFPDLPVQTATSAATGDPLSPIRRRSLAGASNAWAAAPSRSTSGGTLLANDPHLGFSAPTIWYLARLQLEAGDVIGATIPGMPIVLAGRSQTFGWGLTSSYLDDQDVYIEKLNPNNPQEVLTPRGYRPMAERTSVIKVRDSDPVEITLQWTENGPVMHSDLWGEGKDATPESHFDLDTITPTGHVASLAWTVLWPADTSMTSGVAIMNAKSVEEGLAAAEDYIAPSQNLILADTRSIAMKTIGAMPRRSARHQTHGRIPTPGWEAENRWLGRMGYSANPEFVAPPGGIVGNTNNKALERPFPLHVSHYYGDTQRVRRWQFLMQNREVHTRESFIEAQLDEVSPTAQTLLPLIAKELWFSGEAAPEGTPERQRQVALELLAEWNGEMNEHLPEPLIYAAWMRALQERLIRDELGPLAREYDNLEPVFVERVFRDVFGASVWCDVIQSERVETCSEIADLALGDALVWISENHGSALESLRWGDAHQATHDSQVLGQVPILGWIVNIRQSTGGGDNTLRRGRTSGQEPAPFLNVHGAGYRGVYDFADPDSSVFIISTGQSGHPLSRHYDDLGQLWRRGEYIPMSLDPDLARAAAVGVTTLVPK